MAHMVAAMRYPAPEQSSIEAFWCMAGQPEVAAVKLAF
jgi:hypothetical protein